MKSMNIALVDFKGAGLEVQNEEDIEESKLEDVGKQLLESLSSSGFAHVVNHGVPQSHIEDLNKMGDEFFFQPDEYKVTFCTRSAKRLCYDPMGQITPDLDNKVPDLNEGLRFPCYDNGIDQWPDVPHLKEKVHEMQSVCKVLLLRIMKALGLAMKLKDKDLFARAHNLIGEEGNMTLLKLLRYPAIVTPVIENQMRISQHCDAGSVTLLFQDNEGGFQIQSPGGDFADVPCKTGAMLVNVGDTLQHWTGQRVKSPPHRVIVPMDPDKRLHVRRTVAYIGSLNDDVMLQTPEFKDAEAPDVRDKKVVTAYEFMMHIFRTKVYNN